jgi:hypothetical protein
MSQFGGWVQMPRLHLQHVVSDEITGLEHYTLMVLTLLADAATGGDRINAPILCYWTGQAFNHDTAGRILASLHAKKRIWYRARRQSKKAQPYWVNGYVLTRGLHKLRQINLSQLYEGESICQDDVWKSASQPTDHDADQATDQDADNYKNRYKRMKTDNTVIGTTEAAAYAEACASTQVATHTVARDAACAQGVRRRAEAQVAASRISYQTARSVSALAYS